MDDERFFQAPPPLPTVAPTDVPTVLTLNPKPLLPPYCCPYRCPYCTLPTTPPLPQSTSRGCPREFSAGARCPVSTGRGPQRVRLVRGRDAACPVSTGEGRTIPSEAMMMSPMKPARSSTMRESVEKMSGPMKPATRLIIPMKPKLCDTCAHDALDLLATHYAGAGSVCLQHACPRICVQ